MGDGQPDGLEKEGLSVFDVLRSFLDARVPEPAVDLAALVRHLANAVHPLPTPNPDYPRTALGLLTWNRAERALVLATDAVLLRLRMDRAARESLEGFLIDAKTPRSRARAHLGGSIKPSTEAQLRDATRLLVAAIDEQIRLVEQAGFDPAALSTTPAASVLGELGRRLGVRPERALQGPTRISPMRIGPVGGARTSARTRLRALSTLSRRSTASARHTSGTSSPRSRLVSLPRGILSGG